jgi:mono/diheme cytochrome c family protein
MFVIMFVMVGCSSQETAPADQGKPSAAETQLERGRYLAEGVMACFACHAEVDWKASGAPPLPGKKGAGAVFPEEGLPGVVVASNITPDRETGAGTWTDEQLAKAIREGIGHDGRRLFPVMPYLSYREMSDDDVAAVVAYVRTLSPVRNELPKTQLPEPVKAGLPPHIPITQPIPALDLSDPITRGEYLVKLGDCASCHTPTDRQGRPIMELTFAGGWTLKGPWGEVAAANITPDASGISYYDEALFLEAMRTGNVKSRKLNSVMLWGYYRHMTDEDLKAVFAYLRTLKPIQHRVDNTEPPTPCKRCGYTHGLGASNG